MQSKAIRRLSGAVIATLSCGAWAGLPDVPPAPVSQAVSELLMMDARRAVVLEREKGVPDARDVAISGQAVSSPGGDAAGSHSAKSAPLLTSIYGVGNRLHAQLVIDGQETLYASGRLTPVAGTPNGWRLRRIAPPCVDLESESSGVMRLCATRLGALR